MAAGAGDLFVAGRFTTAGGILVTNLARWDGNQWHSMEYAPSPYPPFNSFSSLPALAAGSNELYVCERTTVYGSSDTIRVRKWESNVWGDVGLPILLASLTGDYASVQSMASVGTNLFIAGHFTVTNEFFATNIAYWNGSSWAGMSHPFGAAVTLSPMTSDGTNLFVAVSPYGITSPEIKLAKWNGVTWKILGTGLTRATYGPQVSALAIRGRDLLVGGYFSTAGGKPANNLAIWHDFPEVNLSARGWQLNGHFGLRIHGGQNQLVQAQFSTNLQSWNNLGTQLPGSDPFDFEDATNVPDTRRFYRLVLLP
jgi:hypothetical protein